MERIETDKDTMLQKFIRIKNHDFPIQNPFDYHSKCNKGLKLHTVEYPQHGELKGVIIFLHGHSEFVDQYGQFFTAFAMSGFRIFAYDRKGFGKSEGSRGKIGDHIVQECVEFIKLVTEERNLEKTQIFLYGTSMGGLLAARVAIEASDLIDGIIMVSPWIAPHESFPSNKAVRLSVKVGAKLAPGFNLKPKKGALHPEREEYIQHLIKTYPHFGPYGIQFQTLNKSLLIQEFVRPRGAHITCPVLMCLGSNDEVVSNRAAEVLFNSMVNSPSKTLVTLSGCSHAVHMQDGEQ